MNSLLETAPALAPAPSGPLRNDPAPATEADGMHAGLTLLGWTVPQLLLLALNWSDARLLFLTATSGQKQHLVGYALFWVAVFLGVAGWLAQLQRVGRRLDPWRAMVVFLAPLVLLCGYAACSREFWSRDIAPWMLDPTVVWNRQWMFLLVPSYVAFASLVRRRKTGGRSTAFDALIWTFLASTLAVSADLTGGGRSEALVGIPFLMLAGLATFGMLRLLHRAQRQWEAETSPGRSFAVLIGLLAPLGGLWLNAVIAFPADLQSPITYALTIANGLILCWPDPASPEARRMLWLARCAAVSFTGYFVLIFLPFLVFWVPGLLVLGGGLLVLAPFALADLHFSRIAAGWREFCTTPHSTVTAAGAILAMLAGPVVFVGQCVAERGNLRTALNALHYPALRTAELPQVDPAGIRRALKLGAASRAGRSRDPFTGPNTPILDDIRHQIILGGLAIPAPRRAELAAAFLPPGDPAQREFADRRPNVITPPRGVVLRAREITTNPIPGAPGWEQTRVVLRIHNPTADAAEWIESIGLPTGAFVTDYGLLVGNDRVPGRLTDRNTALFVYERISRVELTLRDPGLLIYKSPESLDLRVFPVLPQEVRETDLTFTHRTGEAGRIAIGRVPLTDKPSDGGAPSQLVRLPNGAAFFPQPTALSAFAFVREPQVVLVSDGSGKPTGSAADVIWQAAGSRLTRVERLDGSIPRSATDPVWPAPLLVRVALAEQLRALEAGNSAPSRRPQLEWNSERLFPTEIVPFAWTIAADLTYPGGEPAPAVVVLRCGGVIRAIRPETPVVWFDEAKPGAGVEIYDPATKQFRALETQAVESAAIKASVDAWLVARERELHPERFRENSRRLWQVARAARTLTPQTAFMVVENLAQWAMLEKKEKERENAPDILENPASVPEPGTWALLIGGGAALLWAARRKRLATLR